MTKVADPAGYRDTGNAVEPLKSFPLTDQFPSHPRLLRSEARPPSRQNGTSRRRRLSLCLAFLGPALCPLSFRYLLLC